MDENGTKFVKKNKSNPITAKQKEILVEFISKRPEMYTGRFSASYTRDKMKGLWSELTNILNSVPGGPAKDWQQWRKTWIDFKKNSKAKLSDEKKYLRGTGGGPPLLTNDKTEDKSIEEKMLTIISPVSIAGNMNVDESEVQFDFDDTDDMLNTEINTFEFPDVELCVTNKFTKVNHEDHNYGASSELSAKPNTSNNIRPTPTSSKRKKITKTTRLTDSLRNNKRFLEISEENLKSEKQFREKKIEILQNDSENRKVYQQNKLLILNNISQVAIEIAADIKMLREHIKE